MTNLGRIIFLGATPMKLSHAKIVGDTIELTLSVNGADTVHVVQFLPEALKYARIVNLQQLRNGHKDLVAYLGLEEPNNPDKSMMPPGVSYVLTAWYNPEQELILSYNSMYDIVKKNSEGDSSVAILKQLVNVEDGVKEKEVIHVPEEYRSSFLSVAAMLGFVKREKTNESNIIRYTSMRNKKHPDESTEFYCALTNQ